MLQMPSDDLAPKFALNAIHPVPKPLLVMLDETPRAAQTLRFVIDNLIKHPQEPISLLFTLPPCKSTLLKQKVTSRIMSFITLCTEPYTSTTKPILKLFLVDRVDLLDAIQDLVLQLDPRMFVFGAANVSFAIKGDVDRVLQVGTGAAGIGYYASTYVPQTAPASPVFSGSAGIAGSAGTATAAAGIASRNSYSSLGAPAVMNDNDLDQHESLLGALWTSLAAARRASAVTPGHDLQGHVPEGKSAYIVEGAFADAVKEHVSVPVVVVKVTVAV
ncbi:hypothetical protein BJ741DRAFT_630518 [Chytriomyces cf. hyalinus JEL632]|nr:hypothetical protein BJ741DRAFT_630518 [Chytriomyces cf. hyalinus JEL632]